MTVGRKRECRAGWPVPGTTSHMCRPSTCRSPLPSPPRSSSRSHSSWCAIARARSERRALPGTATRSTPRYRALAVSWRYSSPSRCAPTTTRRRWRGPASAWTRSRFSGAGSSPTRRARVSSIARPQPAGDPARPRGTTVEVMLRTRDVVHAFWIPDLRFKRDAWPRKVARFDLRFPAGRPAGVGHCAQYCGLNHSDMASSSTPWTRRASRAGRGGGRAA